MKNRPRFEELDFQPSPLGDLILRRRTVLSLENQEIYEIILGNAFLMSSLFTKVEEELSRITLKAATEAFPGEPLQVVVGGLGLGCTAKAALNFPEVDSLTVIEYLQPVIDWHEAGLVPLGKDLAENPRCHFHQDDFFKVALEKNPSSDSPFAQPVHVVLLDIDHSPDHLLTEKNSSFYSAEGLEKFAKHLRPGGFFGLWSDDPPEEKFLEALAATFSEVSSHVVPFTNPISEREFESTVYLAKKISG